ncbi:MAG: TetR/AcrR family transcriptional regulator [Actinomycetota bacterium]|nr:TetR/AcrR family transcriptional regulator [Actinomycetota bacterium]
MARRGPYAKSRAVRETILSAALDVVAVRGFSDATVAEIAEAVEMSKAGVLHHFGSRDELFAAVLEHRDERNNELHKHNDAVDAMFAVIDHNTDVPGLVALFSAFTAGGAAGSPASAAHRFTAERYDRIVAQLADAIAHRPGWCDRPHDDAVEAARLLIAATDGLQTQWLVNRSVDMAAAVRNLWAALDRGGPAPVLAAPEAQEPDVPDPHGTAQH